MSDSELAKAQHETSNLVDTSEVVSKPDSWVAVEECELETIDSVAVVDSVVVADSADVADSVVADSVDSVDSVDEPTAANQNQDAVVDCADEVASELGEDADSSVVNSVLENVVYADDGGQIALQVEAKPKKKKKAKLAQETNINSQAVAAGSVSSKDSAADSAATEPSTTSTKDKAKSGEICFADLALSDLVQQAVALVGYEIPTAIQVKIIPHVLEGRDVLAQSQTGTGKTAAFALPILSKITTTNRRSPQVLVLAPTRELAIQVASSFQTYGQKLPNFNIATIYGGQDYEIQFRQLHRGAQVVVGTPGRVIDHINRGSLDVSGLTTLVLDEADEMLNMGFLEDVQFVLDKAPQSRQIALFSATLPGPIRNIAERYLNDPVQITIKQKTMTAESIRQRAVFLGNHEKIDALCRFLEAEESDGVIVFMKTKDSTVVVAEQLSRAGLRAIALNGDMPQKVRERTIEQLKAGKLDILVATDVAARGLDVPRISHVFNFDLPHDSESYIHRIGRTGRAGRSGEAIIFLTSSQRGKLRLIERATKQPIEIVQPPNAHQINALRIAKFKEKLTQVIASEDLSLFQKMVVDYAVETETATEAVAAALAHIGQQGRQFLMKDRPNRQREENAGGNRQSNDRFERGSDNSGARERRQGGAPRPGMFRYRIEVGWNDGVKPGNIVGAVANEAGISGQDIGPINIFDSHSTIDLPEGMPGDVFETLQETRINGRPLRLRAANPGDGEPQRSFSRAPRTGGPGRDFGGKGPRKESPRGESRGPNASKGGKFAKGPRKAKPAFGKPAIAKAKPANPSHQASVGDSNSGDQVNLAKSATAKSPAKMPKKTFAKGK